MIPTHFFPFWGPTDALEIPSYIHSRQDLQRFQDRFRRRMVTLENMERRTYLQRQTSAVNKAKGVKEWAKNMNDLILSVTRNMDPRGDSKYDAMVWAYQVTIRRLNQLRRRFRNPLAFYPAIEQDIIDIQDTLEANYNDMIHAQRLARLRQRAAA